MASKRVASTELDHDNWNQEEEHEEAGTFQKAPDEVLQRRVIKAAKRRIPASGESEGSAKNVFSTFSGFSKAPLSSSTKSTFNFLATLAKPSTDKPITDTKTNGIEGDTDSKKKLNSINEPATVKFTETTTSAPTDSKTKDTDPQTEYYAKLKGLNESVSQWIKTHVDSNPICILTPIFKDYEKYLAEIEAKKDKKSESDQKQSVKTFSAPLKSDDSAKLTDKKPITNPLLGSFAPLQKPEDKNKQKKSESEEVKPVSNPFITPLSAGSSGATFSFGQSSINPITTAPSTGFSFGSGKPFSFGNVAMPATKETEKKDVKDGEEDESDEPPKVEFTPVEEDNSVYSIRCKVFAKKGTEYVERGIGKLYLKKAEGTEKMQLIVRADTNLGNLIVNTLINESMPMQKMGKNNVMIVCIPTPDSKPPPIGMLLKVKTSKDADELLKNLEKYKK